MSVILLEFWKWIWSRVRLIGFFLYDNWKFTLPAILLILLVMFAWKSCGKKKVSIDLEKVEKINSANRAEREKAFRDFIEENADVARTVDNRTAIAETNVVERNKEVDAAVKEADRKVQEAKEQTGRDVTQEELECLLVPENCS